MKKKRLVHVSYDLVDKFVPRIPKQRAKDENASIERICVAPDISHAMLAIPQFATVAEYMRELKLPVIIHVYYLESNSIMNWEEVAKYVPDAPYTKESWILEEPASVHRVDYEIVNFKIKQGHDTNGDELACILEYKLKRCKYQSNVDIFLNSFIRNADVEKEKRLRKMFDELSFRGIMSNVGKEIIEKMVMKQ